MEKTPAELIKEQFEAIEKNLDTKLQGKSVEMKSDITAAVKEAVDKLTANPGMTADEVKTLKEDVAKAVKEAGETVKGFDEFMKKYTPGSNAAITDGPLLLGAAVEKALRAIGIEDLGEKAGHKIAELEKEMKSMSGMARLSLGEVDLAASFKDMTTANSLTGDPQRTYNNRQGIIPAQKVNFRDLMNSVNSPTGTYVTYTEDSGETNNIASQTEGATKGQNAYNLTEKVNTQNFIAGFSVFTKQLLRNLPFLQGTLPRLLLRDFYKKENSIFFTAVSSAATGPTSMGSSADDVRQLINLIGGFLNTDFNASYVVVNPVLMARLITSTYITGYYPGAGSVVLNAPGNMAPISIFGVPIFSATWVTANKALLVDMDYLERVETEGLNLAFSYEDNDNFRKNLITARIECQESVNLMLAQAACYADLGAS